MFTRLFQAYVLFTLRFVAWVVKAVEMPFSICSSIILSIPESNDCPHEQCIGGDLYDPS